MPSELVVRPATDADAESVAALHLAARRSAYPWMPAPVDPDEEVLGHIAGQVRAGHPEHWVAEDGAGLVGYAALTATWLDALYVAPGRQRAGVGSTLLEVVKALRPAGFGLWVFVSNTPARAFYRHHGLRAEETTDGQDNAERRPDVRMVWAPDAPRPATGLA